MRNLKKVLLLTLAVTVMSAGAASAQQWFDFNGQVLLPAGVGGDLTLYGVVNNNDQVDTPLPLDFSSFEYTIVIEGLTFLSTGFTEQYAGGTVTIYEDAGTAADYTMPSTFSDGTALLVGNVVSLGRSMFTSSSGSVSGSVDWVAGSRLDEIAPADRIGWALVSGVSTRTTVTLPGYDENWDGKVEPQDPIVPTDAHSWGEVKSSY